MSDCPADYLVSLPCELCELPRETEWVEFKMNGAEPQAIGEHISALTNSAALMCKAFALVRGVRDQDHALVGTTFDPRATRVGNEELESWLLRLLETHDRLPILHSGTGRNSRRLSGNREGRPSPRALLGSGVIRVGTYKKKLKDFPEKKRALWLIFDQAPFEAVVATERATANDVLRLSDYPASAMLRLVKCNTRGAPAGVEKKQGRAQRAGGLGNGGTRVMVDRGRQRGRGWQDAQHRQLGQALQVCRQLDGIV